MTNRVKFYHGRPTFLLSFLLLIAASRVSAQPLQIGDPTEDFARVLQVAGQANLPTMLVRPVSAETIGIASDSLGAWAKAFPKVVSGQRPFSIALYNPRLFLSWNSRRPSGENDGVLWQGRGATSALEGGAFMRVGPVAMSLRPIVMYTQNRDFPLSRLSPLPNLSQYAYPRSPLHGMSRDVPQRFGSEPLFDFDWGQSFVALERFGARVGVSNENMWWGPGLRGSISMTNNAPGFPHLFIGSSEPIETYIGALEGKWLWGSLTESEYFDEVQENDTRYVTAITLAYSPRWIDGLSLGFGRVFHRIMPERLRFKDIFATTDLLFKAGSWLHRRDEDTGFYVSDEYDQVISLFARWIFSESDAEIYAEWGRGDHALDARDFILEPSHGRGYLVGFQKLFDLRRGRLLRTFVEVSSLEATKTWLTRRRSAYGTFFYAHTRSVQGYTQRGQLIGAWIGPGSSSQTLGLTLFAPWGRTELIGERVAYDNDLYYTLDLGPTAHKVGLDLAVNTLVLMNQWGLEGGVAYERLLNEDYRAGEDGTNWRLMIGVRYLIGS